MLTLVAINIIMFLYEVALGPGMNRLVMAYGTVPFEITHGQDIPPRIAPTPVYLTLFTSMFLHANILHLASNMLFLWVFGDNVEDRLGHLRFLGFYLLCGVLAALTQIATSPDAQVPAIGASGAIAGVLAAYVVLFPTAQVRTLLFIGIFFTITRISALFLIGFWVLLQFVFGLVSLGEEGGGVAYFAHIGGFVAGLVLIEAFRGIGLMARD
jgi:membrane associated rhomboid family serine protease